MLLHIDGSKHCWFQNSQRYDLIVILDDATSEIYYAQLVEEESTREHYIDAFNRKFAVGTEQKGSAFRCTSRSDLDWVFTVQTERMVAKGNTVAIGERVWQIEKSRFRSTLADCTVTIHGHLDGRVSLRYGLHIVGRCDGQRPATRQSKQTEAQWERRLTPPKP